LSPLYVARVLKLISVINRDGVTVFMIVQNAGLATDRPLWLRARSMSDRCQIVLQCVDDLPSKVVAVELGVHEHPVGKWRRRFLKDCTEGRGTAG
jgi:hypothetical protein